MQIAQAKKFYDELSKEEKEELAEVIANDLFFKEEDVYKAVLCALQKVDKELSERIREINGFTIR